MNAAANLEGVITLDSSRCLVDGQAQHVYFINYLNLFTNLYI
jgi:hypothetical protein